MAGKIGHYNHDAYFGCIHYMTKDIKHQAPKDNDTDEYVDKFWEDISPTLISYVISIKYLKISGL